MADPNHSQGLAPLGTAATTARATRDAADAAANAARAAQSAHEAAATAAQDARSAASAQTSRAAYGLTQAEGEQVARVLDDWAAAELLAMETKRLARESIEAERRARRAAKRSVRDRTETSTADARERG